MAEESKISQLELEITAKGLRDMQTQLEPIRDKALDQKSFYTGYAQCAESFIKLILQRADAMQQQAREVSEPKEEERDVAQDLAETFKDAPELPLETESTGEDTEDTNSPE